MGFEFGVWCLGFGVEGLEFGDLIWILDFGFWVLGSVFLSLGFGEYW